MTAAELQSDRIGAHHRTRKAILYMRQSSAHQVQHNRESRMLQYAMRDRLSALGWSEIDVIDKDLGLSAAGGTARAGFERMVAQVCLATSDWAMSALSRRARSPALPATAATGSSWWRCVAWSIRC